MSFIKDIFWDTPKDFWKYEGFFGKIMALVWFLLIAFLAFLLFGLSFMAIDRTFLSYVQGQAEVIGKRFDPAHTETYMQTIQSGNTTIIVPQTNYYPDRYYLQLQVKNLSGEQQVNVSTYNEMRQGNIVEVKYSKRRITDELSFE